MISKDELHEAAESLNREMREDGTGLEGAGIDGPAVTEMAAETVANLEHDAINDFQFDPLSLAWGIMIGIVARARWTPPEPPDPPWGRP